MAKFLAPYMIVKRFHRATTVKVIGRHLAAAALLFSQTTHFISHFRNVSCFIPLAQDALAKFRQSYVCVYVCAAQGIDVSMQSINRPPGTSFYVHLSQTEVHFASCLSFFMAPGLF